ncbi:hypothetical protein [Streptomyces parvulus]|uniref:hypothetical protein n=1 Tax=Streptomyces parvulus TaxID=146923 RepID=UPI0033BEA9EC
MPLFAAAARWYYRWNIAVWRSVRRRDGLALVALVSVYLAATAALRHAGHPDTAWALTIAAGAPLIVMGWTNRT